MGVITIIKPDGTTEYTVRPTHAYTGTCSTAAGTAAKTVTISPAIDNFLEAGVRITVYFSNANTAKNPTLSINSGTAKAIYKGSSAITKALLSVGYHDFIYDGTQWQYVSSYIDTNTTYAQLSSSNTNTLGSYVVPGAGSNTGNFLRGDGTWMPKCAVGGSEKASNDIFHKIYYESSVTNNSGLLYIKFKDRDGATLAINTLVNGTIYNFVFRSDTPASPTRFALKDDTTASAVSFYAGEGNEVWFGSITKPLIPTNMVLQFKKDSNGLKYVGPSNLYNMLSSTNSAETLGHVVKGAGSNTGYFLRGDGEWQTPTNTTYAQLSSSNTNTAGSYVVKGAGSNTSYFLRGDGNWQPVSGGGGGTYTTLNSNSLDTGQYVVKGIGNPSKATDFFLRADGEWDTVQYHVDMPLRLNSFYIGEDVNGIIGSQVVLYEYSRRIRGSNLEGVIFTTNFHDGNTIYDISNIQTGQTCYIVFTHPVTVNKRLVAWDLNEKHEEISFMTKDVSGYFIDYTLNPFPTNIILQFKKTNLGLVYLGPALPVLYSNADTNGRFMVRGAGTNTGKFLRGDGEWITPSNTTYAKLSSSNTNTAGSYVVKGAGSNTGYFLRGDGSWQPVSGGGGTTYDYISASNTSTNTSYVVRGAGANTDCFLRGDGYWGMMHEFTGATNTSGGEKGIVPKPTIGDEHRYLRGDGNWYDLPQTNFYKEFSCSEISVLRISDFIHNIPSEVDTVLSQVANSFDWQTNQKHAEVLYKFRGLVDSLNGESDVAWLTEFSNFIRSSVSSYFDNADYDFDLKITMQFRTHPRWDASKLVFTPIHFTSENEFNVLSYIDFKGDEVFRYDDSYDELVIRELKSTIEYTITQNLSCYNAGDRLSPNYSYSTKIIPEANVIAWYTNTF